MTKSIAGVLFFHCASSVAQSQVELERFFPPAVARGISSTIKADGKFPQWPVRIECDQTDLPVTCSEKAGEFQVSPSASALGVAWIRLLDDQSASSLVPLVIEPTTVTVEVEPNESLSKATLVSSPATIVGKLEKNGDVDMWKLALHASEQLVASVTAHTLLGSPMDSVLQLVDSRGLVVAQAEDSVGLDPQLIFTANRAGDYYLRLFCFPETPTGTIGFAGGANFNYLLRITTSAFLDHSLPFRNIAADKLKPIPFGWNLPEGLQLEVKAATEISPATIFARDSLGWQWLQSAPPTDWSFGGDGYAPAPGPAYALPLLYCGHVREPKEIDQIRFRVHAGVNYRAEIASREYGFKLDSVLRVLKSDMKTLIARNDDSSRNNFDAAVDFKVENDEELIVEVSDLADSGSLRHAYELQIAVVEPKAKLLLAADHFRISIGRALEIPITIERQSGYAQRLEIAVKTPPPGISLDKAYSEAKGDSSKTVKLKLTAAPDASPFQGPIELMATPVDDKQAPAGEPLPIQFTLRPQISLSSIWLTIAAEKP